MPEATQGITDLSSHPLVEGGVLKILSPEASKDTLAKQRAREAQNKGINLIEAKMSSGFFDTSDKADAKTDADRAIKQNAEKKILDSDGLKSFFSTTSAIGVEAAEIEKAAAKNMRVKVGDRMLSLDDWRKELKNLKNPDGTLIDPAKVKELEDGIFAYDLPPEEAGEGKTDAGALIDQKLTDLEAKKDKSPDDEKLLLLLRVTKRAEKGEIGALVRERALGWMSILDKTANAEKIKSIADSMAEDIKPDQAKLDELFSNNKLDQTTITKLRQAFISGNITDLIKEGALGEVVGLRDLLFGKENGRSITNEELQRLLDPENKKDWSKLGNIFGILFALMFAADISKQVLSQENR